ncbi:quinolinate synthase [Paenibacillus sp. ACRRX]|uniref:quinolinate synthase n=1 Tax=Paenibacillus sp. ACRRX TaxID=2918206 RepID=UPI001EF50C66|nr:quinolinate synthase [Paenibacillus sp. ACRRX]MCG7406652.1 quinolinate synthase [Paenibacillus sp. ACRRX]
MKQIRWIPLLSTILISGSLLFGGWYIYRHQLMEAPLQTNIKDISHVQQAEVNWQPKQVVIKLRVSPNSDIREVVQHVYEETAKQAQQRTVDIQVINDKTSHKLEKWWSEALFPVSEAMAHQRYGDIPDKLASLAKDKGVKVQTEMDNQYVYVTVKDDEGNSKVVLLPLQGQPMGVWPNAKSDDGVA